MCAINKNTQLIMDPDLSDKKSSKEHNHVDIKSVLDYGFVRLQQKNVCSLFAAVVCVCVCVCVCVGTLP